MDDLERRVRAARPLSGHRDLPLSDRAKRELADLLLATSHASRRRRDFRRGRVLRAVGATAVAATVAVLGGIAASSLLTPDRAYAATPPILSVSPTSETTEELLTVISQHVDSTPTDPAQISVEAWTLQTDDDGKAVSSSVVPERYEITRGSDGSYSTTVTTGQAVDGTGAPIGDAPEPGEPVWEESWKPGEYQFLFSAPFPEDAGLVGTYFRQALATEGPLTAAAAIQATNDLLFEQQLSGPQLTALLQFFATQPDLYPLGEVTDRLGRPGVAFTADDPDRPGYERHLIVSPETGRILATETLYIGTGRTDIASPSVVNYLIWK